MEVAAEVKAGLLFWFERVGVGYGKEGVEAWGLYLLPEGE